MEIDISAIILVIAIVVANLIVLVKLFYPEEKEEQKILKKYPAVSKFWEETMDDKQKEILTKKKNVPNFETDTEKTDSYNDKTNNYNKKMSYEEDFLTGKDEYGITIDKNLNENESLNVQNLDSKIANKDNKVVEITIEDEIYKLTLKDNIIFIYNNENYSSYVLDIKHENVKVKYRSQEKWITFSEIRKIL